MRRIWDFLIDSRTLAVLGVALVVAFIFLGASTLRIAMVWAVVLLVVILLIYAGVWWWRRRRARKSAEQLGDMLTEQANRAVKAAPTAHRAEMKILRSRLLDAIKTIKTSKLGETSGAAALYELPWYMVIGNPAAGKSTAIVNSGLHFPFADQGGTVLQGIGGTRNCDWFFTTEGILLDTAGRYSVHDEDRDEWLGFLSLLKKFRPRAPINGILIAVSVTEIASSRPEAAIQLAKQLRGRVQEVTEKLEIFAPVYVVFTKADLIPGFIEFFEENDRGERDRVWGATMQYDADGSSDAVGRFDTRFDELYEGLRAMGIARLSMVRSTRAPSGLLTFPLEFAALKPALRGFVATLFEDNPFQFKPVFRGFYFTSALQEGEIARGSGERVAKRFGIELPAPTTAPTLSQNGFFLRELFSKVIFADRELVRQYASRAKLRWRYVSFFAGLALLGLVLGGMTWSMMGNRQLAANVQADLDQVIKLQDGRIDLQSRFAALEVLQDRIEQLQRYRSDRPWSIGFGLYQGDRLEQKLRQEYFAGVRDVMLKPVAESIEAYLTDVNLHADKLAPATKAGEEAVVAGTYKEASPTSVEDAYNALKTYLMLAERERIEPGHLSDQITRFWRGWLEVNRGNMPREQTIRSAERMIAFYVSQVSDPTFPMIDDKLALVDQTRASLTKVMHGMPARERVYAEIKARAATRYAPLTVARITEEGDKPTVAGSYVVPGAFTREAWQGYVEEAIRDAANKELQSTDWVLKTKMASDLTLEGSPEQIQKALVQMYKTEYVHEWQKFMQGVSVAGFENFDQAVVGMNRLGDPTNSPIAKLMNALYEQTAWDNPSMVNQGLEKAQRGFVQWFRETILRQAPAQVNVNVNVSTSKPEIPLGPIGKEFAPIAQLMIARGSGDASLMRGYLDQLSKIRTRFNQIKTQGDPGPASRQLMQQTFEGNGSELADALRYVDEQMLVGMSDSARATIRPLLVRPLIQSFATIVKPTEAELNKTWTAQVYEPFSRSLATKYPFASGARIEATAGEIAQFFGPDGAIAKYVQTAMGPLVVRRGDALTARTWADTGVTLVPDFTNGFSTWVAPLGEAAGGGAAGGGQAQTSFQIQPLPSPGLSEYTIDIDGQILRYRNTQADWSPFVWPGSPGPAGARINAVTFDGRTVELLNEPGRYGLERMISSAQNKKRPDGAFELTWVNGKAAVHVLLRIISNASAPPAAGGAAGGGTGNLRGTHLPPMVAGGPPATPAPTPPATAAVTTPAQGVQR